MLIELKSFKKFTAEYFRHSYNEHAKERYISPEEREEVNDKLRLK